MKCYIKNDYKVPIRTLCVQDQDQDAPEAKRPQLLKLGIQQITLASKLLCEAIFQHAPKLRIDGHVCPVSAAAAYLSPDAALSCLAVCDCTAQLTAL